MLRTHRHITYRLFGFEASFRELLRIFEDMFE